ncbi:helix-turn-helix transcriptional regulator [Shewanella aestuarii]|uniref:Helix-turn-helix transcriptional regulator n=1 Tax=Shewanella aestuarii TaxID=1028752 RepID=A0A6G9QPY2_9GAMM|nr:helix-turn-helix transcriptional regulator [Shewanella aestuarii]QIR16650.1 helix-turn-helix transcriptional regulator [Shewanella aestuarii]
MSNQCSPSNGNPPSSPTCRALSEMGEDINIYHYEILKQFLLHRNAIAGFNSKLRELGITQKTFCQRVGITEQAVSKWKRTQIPKWVWYALRGMQKK